jgi:chromosomal replication initiator protein
VNNYVNNDGNKLLLLLKENSVNNEDLTLRQIKIIDTLTLNSFFDNNLILEVGTDDEKLLLTSITTQFLEPFLKEKTEQNISIFLKVSDTKKITPPVKTKDREFNFTKNVDQKNETKLLSDYTFENFIVSSSNHFIFQACAQISEAPGEKRLNPFYMYGDPGLGKTHLLHAIGNHISKIYPQKTVLYTTAENFLNDYIEAMRIRKDAPSIFRNRYEKVDVLLIDDIQFFSEDMDNTIKTFYHIFNQRINEKKQCVITADVQPNLLKGLHQRMISRFGGSVHWKIEKPDFELRVNFIRKYISDNTKNNNKLNFSNNIQFIEKIASILISNIRELEGAIDKILFFCEINNTMVSEEIIDSVLLDYINYSNIEININSIINVTAEYFNITAEEILSKNRTPQLTTARHVAMYLSRKLTPLTLIQIGSKFNKDHSSVLNAEKKITQNIKDKTKIYNTVNEITNKLKKT